MSLLGKGVNKLFTSLGSLLKKIVELLYNLLGFIKFKISKKGYNVREESSKKGKIAGRRVKNNMDKFAIKAQVATDKGIIFLGKFLRLFTFGILNLFNTISRNLYKASEKSKDKFTTYNISQDEKNKEKFIEFDNLIAKCNDIENYEEAAISNFINNTPKDLENTIFSNGDNKFKNSVTKELDYNSDKNLQNKAPKETPSDLDKTLFKLTTNTYDEVDDDVKEYTKEESFVPDLDKTLFQDDDNMYNSIKAQSFSKALEDINSSFKGEATYDSKNIEEAPEENYQIKDIEDANNISIDSKEAYYTDENYEDDADYNDSSDDLNNEEDLEDDVPKKNMFNFLKKKEKKSSFDETFHGEDYEFNSSIKLANENYSKNQQNNENKSKYSKNTETNLDRTQFVDLKSLREDSDRTQMINMDDFREAVNSKLHESNNSADDKINNSYRYSLDDDDESIRKFLSDD